jgi:hypothetical protein
MTTYDLLNHFNEEHYLRERQKLGLGNEVKELEDIPDICT